MDANELIRRIRGTLDNGAMADAAKLGDIAAKLAQWEREFSPRRHSLEGTNNGHGHVWERPDGLKARCGGPRMCPECAADFALVYATEPK